MTLGDIILDDPATDDIADATEDAVAEAVDAQLEPAAVLYYFCHRYVHEIVAWQWQFEYLSGQELHPSSPRWFDPHYKEKKQKLLGTSFAHLLWAF